MTTLKGFANIELLQVADAVAREEAIPKESVIVALEDTIKVAAKRKYGYNESLKVRIDRKTGEIKLYREMLVIDDITKELSAENGEVCPVFDDPMTRIVLSEARLKNADVNVGDYIYELLPPLDLSRLAAQSAKNTIVAKVREIKREKEFQEYQERIGEIVSGVVTEKNESGLVVKLGATAEAIIKRDQLIKSDHYKPGDRVKAYLLALNKNTKGHQIILSRVSDQFMIQLFTHAVPEIYNKITEIKAVARDPGSRAKIAVYSSDPSIDPVGSCIGIKGSRIQSITAELNGEKIDVSLWSSDIAQFAVNVLSPTPVSKVIIDEDRHKIEVVVPDEQLSAVIGRKGQNAKLISQLIKWNVTILTETAETKRRQDEIKVITNKFIERLDIEEILAQLLAAEGYTSIAEIANSAPEALLNIQGLDGSIAKELVTRAQDCIENKIISDDVAVEVQNLDKEKEKATGMSNVYEADPTEGAVSEWADTPPISEVIQESAAQFEQPQIAEKAKNKMTPQELRTVLRHAGVKSLQDIADLSADELSEILEAADVNLDQDDINKIIMSARDRVYFHLANN
ncbi:Transcription termination/antitermination protein NusA [Alphaproteobacteria bacterium]